MIYLIFLAICYCSTLFATSNDVAANYQLMDQKLFEQQIVGNTLIGVTHHSHSLYMLHFLPDGACELWKQNHIYKGSWWIEKDQLDQDYVRAFWPDYSSSERNSLFSPQNPRYGNPTAVWYYLDLQSKSLLLVTRAYQTIALWVEGRAF